MSDLTVPRRIERVLAALGASDELRQDILGDLEEEFGIRATWDGPAAARRWYYRESVRVAPHLPRDWWGRFGWRDGFRLVEVVTWSVIATVAFKTIGGAFVVRLAEVVGVAPRRIIAPGFAASDLETLLAGNAFIAVATGYFAASIEPRARVPSAVATATFWAAFISIAWFRFPDFVPIWFGAVNLATCILGIVLGGVIRASRAEEPDAVVARD